MDDRKVAARALGRAFGLLNAIQLLTQADMVNAKIYPLSVFAKIHNDRLRKISEEKAQQLAEILDDVPSDFGKRALTPEEQSEWFLGYMMWQRGGRPPINGSTMPVRQVRVQDDLWDAVKRKAEADGKTISETVRDALEAYVAEEKTFFVNVNSPDKFAQAFPTIEQALKDAYGCRRRRTARR